MKHTIIIDSGHGKETAGKRSPMLHDGRRLYEYEYNRKIANHLETLCKENGLNSYKICEDETSPSLYERVKKANRYISEHPDEQCIFFSIHGNAFGNSTTEWQQPYGWECYLAKQVGRQTEELGQYLCDAIKEIFPKMKLRNLGKPRRENFSVLVGTKCPAVLSENLFYTNYEDCLLMLDGEFQKKIARAHLNCAINFFKAYGK